MQHLSISTLFLSEDSDSFFVELLAQYLHLVEHFKVQLVRADEHLLKAGNPKAYLGVISPGVQYVDKQGHYRSLKVIAQRLTALVSLDELLMGEGQEQVNEAV